LKKGEKVQQRGILMVIYRGFLMKCCNFFASSVKITTIMFFPLGHFQFHIDFVAGSGSQRLEGSGL
jgi:hypothetical protein